MKLNQLKIDSYSSQMNQEELTQVKGGTTPLWVIGGALLLSGCTDNSSKYHITQIVNNSCEGTTDTTMNQVITMPPQN